MKNSIPTTAVSFERFTLEIDGKINSEYAIFQEALKAGLKHRQKFPHSQVKVRGANEQMPAEVSEKAAASA